MRLSRRLIIFLNWFAAGLITPVLSLMLMARGCTLETLALATSAYSATVILCEVPSGIFADLMGRKRCFLLACGLSAAALLWLVFSRGMWALILGMVGYGVARAFSSGSLDALFVEECVSERGEEAISTVAGQLSLWQTLGLAAGALVGGALPNWRGYSLHLLGRVGLLGVLALLCAVLVKETGRGTEQGRTGLRGYLAGARSAVQGNGAFGGLLLCFLSAGALLGTIEVFWQPTFALLATEPQRPLLGVVAVAGFLAATLGNLLIRGACSRVGAAGWRVYLALRTALILAAALLAFQGGAWGFLGIYALVYLVVGGTDVAEQTLLNRMAPDGQRAGLLSAASLFFQVGALLAGGFAALMVGRLGFSGVLLCCCALVAACTLAAALLTGRKICYNGPNAKKGEMEP